MKALILELDQHALRQLLQLPKEATIAAAWRPNNTHGAPLFLRIDGVGQEVSEGQIIPHDYATITTTSTKTETGSYDNVVLNPRITYRFQDAGVDA